MKLTEVFNLNESTTEASKDVLDALKASMVQGMDVNKKPEWVEFYNDVYQKLNSNHPGPFKLAPPTDHEWEAIIAQAVSSEVMDTFGSGGTGNDYGVSQDEVLAAAISDY